MSYLIDTNVLSELRKGARCDARVARWFGGLPSDDIYLSVLAVGEIRRGVERIRQRDSRSARVLEAWLRSLLVEHSDRILPIDQAIADEWGRLNVPDPIPVIDGLMAATARVHGLTLATRNTKDIKRTGVAWIDPFAA
ncbi:MAG TPA: type II toxin-antitoxin system VapC family toxin [Thermoanaerobaculia bacterium]|nr:type II toxin-antitoxin system VapC family toxin [Thermoanaerobaculia bacterium]